MKIDLKHVNYIYNKGLANEAAALKDVSLTIEKPEMIAIIGSTGSGKSTLIQMFNGLLFPTEGGIYFDDIALASETAGSSKRKEKEAQKKRKLMLKQLRRRVGLVFQYPEYQLFDETVIRDVAFGPENLGFSPEAAEIKAGQALHTVGIGEELYGKSPFELSGGEMRRVAIAGVIAMEPEVLVLDEPTAGLDPQGKKDILDCIRGLKEQASQMTVVFVSHNMEEVAEYADRVIVLDRGSVVFDGNTKALFQDHKQLEAIGLKAPEATYICERLGIPGVTCLEEAAEEIIKAVSLHRKVSGAV